MRKLLTVLIALAGLSLVAVDADARRMSGGKNIGKQRESISPNQAAPKAPAQQPQQAAPAAPTQKAAAPAQPPSGMSRFLGPLAGLAIGAGLASLFFNNGLGGALGGILLLAALAFGAFMLFRLIKGRMNPQPLQRPLQYAGAAPYGGNPGSAPAAPAVTPPPTTYGGGAAPHSVAATMQSAPAPATPWPADFDAEQFLRHARLNFVNLQQAHDRRDLSAIRDFLAPDLYRDIEAEVKASGDAPQKTDIVTLNAEVLDVTTDQSQHVVSVRFSGLIREEPGAEAQPFSEVWHLEKPLSGRSGWVVSGIQQA